MPRCGSLVARYGTIIDGVIIGVDASRSSGEIRTGTERYSREVTSALILAGARHRFRLYVRDASLLPVRLGAMVVSRSFQSAPAAYGPIWA